MKSEDVRPRISEKQVDRRRFLKTCGLAASLGPTLLDGTSKAAAPPPSRELLLVDDFDRPDSLYHGDAWESLNPGYWTIENKALRRRLRNCGDRARSTGFPFHYETIQNKPMPTEYDPSLPFGMIWRRDWKLAGNYAIRVEATIKALPTEVVVDDPNWRQHKAGYALIGVCFGGRSLYESWTGGGKPGDAAWYAAWRDDARFGLYDHSSDDPAPVEANAEKPAPAPRPGDKVTIEVIVAGEEGAAAARVSAKLTIGQNTTLIDLPNVERKSFTEGHFGVIARGLLDFEINRVSLTPNDNARTESPLNELHVCYPLGDTLRRIDDRWHCRFVALTRNDGERIEIRVSDAARPRGGWASVPVAGAARIVNNDFRRNTAVIDVALPLDPSRATLYYTVWKDGRDVTADPRTGFLGKKEYVGRLPRLTAPYRLCGLSCHAVHENSPNLPNHAKFLENWIHDQPTPDAYQHLEEYDFQVMLWEDDVWYLELLLFPPSTDDAYKIITTTIAGPTTRWQMMRHWNVLNPGDHDYGMDDVKGPEQFVVRQREGLGQDPEYMRRNFQIVAHLVGGQEDPSGVDNPKRWRRWKMPENDFSLLILDSRLWRNSQDTHLWVEWGWKGKGDVYDRSDPTRTLLGEEQFAWLQQTIRTDSSPLVCLTGINGLHTVWTVSRRGGGGAAQATATTAAPPKFDQRDRGTADFAGWVKAGSDRVIELLGSRDGVVSVYGDVHQGCMMRNVRERLYECSFGPVGRSGGRGVKPGFGSRMRDYDARELEVLALYHQQYETPDLKPRGGPMYWNFLELHFDPRSSDPSFNLKIRNIIDAPSENPRGGGIVDDRASNTGRPPSCSLPKFKVAPNADVVFTAIDGSPLRATRSAADGSVRLPGLIDVAPRTRVIAIAYDGEKATAQVVETLPPRRISSP